MGVNKIELKKLWDNLQGKLDVGTFDVFTSKMSDTESRKKFYDNYHDKLSDKGLKLGDYTEYENRLSSTTGLPSWAKCLESLAGISKRSDVVVLRLFSNGDKIFFSKSGNVQYIYKSGTKEPGKWRCNGTNGYLINLDNGDKWDGSKWIEGSGNTNVDTSSSDEHTELNGIYKTKGDPYQYKIVDCVWYTKGKSITNWKSLEDNQTANDLLDARFPNARKNCKNNKPEEVLKPIIPNFDDEFEDVDDAEEANDIINN